MGMAMTVLSFAMLGRFAGIQVRQLKPSDLNPANVWVALEDKAQRTWDRGVKYYESLRLVYELQTRVKEWTDTGEQDRGAGAGDPKEPVSVPDNAVRGNQGEEKQKLNTPSGRTEK
jgi:hypothetical protein